MINHREGYFNVWTVKCYVLPVVIITSRVLVGGGGMFSVCDVFEILDNTMIYYHNKSSVCDIYDYIGTSSS